MNIQSEILNKILYFCSENGEDPFEYQSESVPKPWIFISWCYGKGYIIKEKFDHFLENYEEYEFFQLFGEDEYALVISEKSGYDYLAEFIASSDFYLERFNNNFRI